eukprot:302830-Prymnesium_polylepis.1
MMQDVRGMYDAAAACRLEAPAMDTWSHRTQHIPHVRRIGPYMVQSYSCSAAADRETHHATPTANTSHDAALGAPKSVFRV